MKFLSKILAVAAIFATALTASAQFDQFAGPRIVVLTPASYITATRTNDVIDIHGFEGVGAVYIAEGTNFNNGPCTNQLVTSSDRTNWTVLSNFAIAVPTSKIYTNLYYGGGTPTATDVFLFPGTNTTPSGASSGFVTPYLNTTPFTNSGSFVMTNYALIGFVIPDQARYLGIDYNIGSQSNTVAAFFCGKKQDQ